MSVSRGSYQGLLVFQHRAKETFSGLLCAAVKAPEHFFKQSIDYDGCKDEKCFPLCDRWQLLYLRVAAGLLQPR